MRILNQLWSLTSDPLVRHLWQSTFFAGVAALFAALVLRRNSAHARHWVWLVASVKFLAPFAWLAAIGERLAHLLPAQTAAGGAGASFFEEFSYGLTGPASTLPAASRTAANVTLSVLACIWALGALVVLLRWLLEWRRVSASIGQATTLETGFEREALSRLLRRAGVCTPVRLATSPTWLEPGVFGFWRPVIVLPAAIRERLDDPQWEAILAHEVIHIRRRDNLIAALHMCVEAIFWFHPLVWWLGARLLEERELACDEGVLHLGSEPQIYAEGILRVCRLCVSSPLECVSAVTGANLTQRIARIMSQTAAGPLPVAKRVLLGSVTAASLLLPVGAGLLAGRITAQTAPTSGNAADVRPSYDIVSIKPNNETENRVMVRFAPGGRFSATGVTLRLLIKIAYDLRDDQIGGGPNWLGSKRFDVDAKCDPPIPGDSRTMNDSQREEFQRQIRLRLQTMLQDRFQLKLSQTSKEMPVYQLVVGKNGPKLKESTAVAQPPEDMPPPAPGRALPAGAMRMSPGELEAAGIPLESLAHSLSEITSRTVLDKTGLIGRYDIHLKWAPDPGQFAMDHDPGAPPPAESNGPSLFTALQEQLGLKLEARKAPAQFFTVESAQPPSEN